MKLIKSAIGLSEFLTQKDVDLEEVDGDVDEFPFYLMNTPYDEAGYFYYVLDGECLIEMLSILENVR